MRYLRQILAVLIGLGLIIFVFVLIIRGFNSNRTNIDSTVKLVNYAASTDSSAVLSVEGPVVGNAQYRVVKITVTQTQVTAQLIEGYQGNVISALNYPSNQSAYAAFLQSLQKLNFTRGNTAAALKDERGYCSAGNRYVYQLTSGADSKIRFWSTSCNSQGTFGGDAPDVRNLFYAQIPTDDFTKLTDGLTL